MKLEGKVVIITGGSSGLGEACIRFFHSRKCKVIIADLNIVLGQQLVSELSSDIHFIETDVSDEESIKIMISKTLALFNSIHVVINSAGVAWAEFTASPKAVHSSELFSNVFKINVLGTFNVCKYAAQQMMKQPFVDDTKEKGVLINIASIAGFEGQKGNVAYAASKASVIAMTLPMARDLGKYGIRVMTLAPGIIDTPMSQLIIPKVRKLLNEQTCLGRFGKPKELAGLCQGIIENEYVSGDVWRIDGGMRLSHF
jgi:NAD(P)-dependent dehydrogenase (short-subunit alcohol dehydrogenase family)